MLLNTFICYRNAIYLQAVTRIKKDLNHDIKQTTFLCETRWSIYNYADWCFASKCTVLTHFLF